MCVLCGSDGEREREQFSSRGIMCMSFSSLYVFVFLSPFILVFSGFILSWSWSWSWSLSFSLSCLVLSCLFLTCPVLSCPVLWAVGCGLWGEGCGVWGVWCVCGGCVVCGLWFVVQASICVSRFLTRLTTRVVEIVLLRCVSVRFLICEILDANC